MEELNGNRDSKYLTYREAAEELGVTVQYVTHLVSQKRFKTHKFPGSRVKYLLRDEVERYARVRAGLEAPSDTVVREQAGSVSMVSSEALESLQQAVQSIDVRHYTGLPAQLVMATDLAPFILRAYCMGQEPTAQLLAVVTDDTVRQQLHRALLKFAAATAD